jgi:hypothetical protein
MKETLFNLMAMLSLAGAAMAGEPLSDAQMDRISAGALSITINCPACVSSSSNTTSTTTNGLTVTMTTGGGTTGGGGGTTGGGDTTGGGTTGGSGGSKEGSGGTPATSLVGIVTLPPNLVSIIAGSTGFSPSSLH